MMTKEDWAEIERSLSFAGCGVHLDCDGYKLAIQRARLTKMRDCLVIYVNGVFKGKWMKEDCQERRRFLCPREAFFYKPKARAKQREMLKKWSKREIREFEKEYFKPGSGQKDHLVLADLAEPQAVKAHWNARTTKKFRSSGSGPKARRMT